ncbi:MAG: sulfotransferase [Caldilineaceae bacterium]
MKTLLKSLFGANPTRSAITIVSGLPRSGTSMMMRMLEAGGLPPLTDHQRTADPDNPQGYYEFERVKQLDRGDTVWLANAQGHAVKVISALLRHLPATYEYKVIFIERHMAEVLASQRKMLTRRAAQAEGETETAEPVDDAQMAQLFTQHLQETRHWLAQQANFRVLYIHYSDLLSEPEAQATQVNQFLGGHLDVAKMATVIDPALYRNRV